MTARSDASRAGQRASWLPRNAPRVSHAKLLISLPDQFRCAEALPEGLPPIVPGVSNVTEEVPPDGYETWLGNPPTG